MTRRALVVALAGAAGLAFAVAQPCAARADTIAAVVSEASAPELSAAAALFARTHSNHTLRFRSKGQMDRMTDAEVRTFVGGADALLLVAVYGDLAGRIAEVLRDIAGDTPAQPFPAHIVPLDGEAILLPLSRIDGRAAFAGQRPERARAALRRLLDAEPRRDDGSPEARIAHAYRYRRGRGAANLAHLMSWLVATPTERPRIPAPKAGPGLRILDDERRPGENTPSVALLDYDYSDRAGDREVHRALCEAIRRRGMGCITALARWGQASQAALARLTQRKDLVGLIVLQDFVVGGGAGTQRAVEHLRQLDVPVLKAVRLSGRSAAAWRASEDGLPIASVHYRLAMPEVQGIGQPFVVGAAGPAVLDEASGLRHRPRQPVTAEIEALAARIARWQALRQKPNRDKKVAIIYYNHPPGRHNIGADNLDVPASLLSVLRGLKAAGYRTGALPKTPAALLEVLQGRGVNLPENRAALGAMAERIARVAPEHYRDYFERLPELARRSMQHGPLGRLRALVSRALAEDETDAGRTRNGLRTEAFQLAKAQVERTLGDIRHVLMGAIHPQREEAKRLLTALERAYERALAPQGGSPATRFAAIDRIGKKLRATGIAGLSGWGPPPGDVMTHRGELLVPGITFGNVFVGPQPPRGWARFEELLHANLTFPPPHQYLAFYAYLRETFSADALVHLGRHSTYEFLPGRRAGVGREDFSRLVIGDRPSVYLYIVDGVGEGIQAKRRGQAVIIDHLTPSLRATPLYDQLLELRQLIESYEAASGVKGHAGGRALSRIRELVANLHLKPEIAAGMAAELAARGQTLDDIDDALFVHEVGHYLTQMQERFMPHGLHIFGQRWSDPAVRRMMRSMDPGQRPSAARKLEAALRSSPKKEMRALLAALSGRFVPPGPGNDPVRTPEVLPTGRNFHALDASVLPTRLGYRLGVELATEARAQSPGTPEGAEAIILWASDTVRDEGAMMAFGLDMLGVRPVWSRRGRVLGLSRIPLEGRRRRDVTFVSSGLFRDLYGHLLVWLDRAVRVALEGAARTIEERYPGLRPALAAALAPLGTGRADEREPTPRKRGSESLDQNQVAAHWVASARALIDEGQPPAAAGSLAAARVFGTPPGAYGAGINRLTERSGAWRARAELSRAFVHRLGHVYGVEHQGTPAHDAFARALGRVEHTYLGRASHLYALLDNNDGFDYLGGLGMAIEGLRDKAPLARVVQHQDPERARIDPLPRALLQELRGRHLNPAYLKGLMQHGYAGARTMGSAFLENLFGWQVTSPNIVRSWVWDEVKAVYLDDRHNIGLNDFLSEGENVHVKTHIQAVLLVAAHKGYWQPGPETLRELSQAFAQAVVEYGLPGSGHTRPDHPMMAEVKARLGAGQKAAFQAALDAAGGGATAAVVTELKQGAQKSRVASDAAGGDGRRGVEWWALWVGLIAGAALLLGYAAGRVR